MALQKVEEEIEKRFSSKIVFSVKVMRPMTKYPYEVAVWDSEISVPVTDDREHVQSIITAWIKTMEAGVELAAAFRGNDDQADEKS